MRFATHEQEIEKEMRVKEEKNIGLSGKLLCWSIQMSTLDN